MKKNENDGFFVGMSEKEIAFFVVFKMPSCLASTRRKIKAELKDIGMDIAEAKALVESTKFSVPPNGHRCRRCGSTKRYKAPNGNGVAMEDSRQVIVGQCLVCGYESEESSISRLRGNGFTRWFQKSRE